MRDPFFITGLPRSRTAWFAVACSGKRVCHHEPGYGDIASAKAIWAKGDGIADAGLGLHLARILQEIGPKTLVIERDPHEVMRSLEGYLGFNIVCARPGVWELLTSIQAALSIEHPLIKRVAYDDLRDIAVVRECMEWLGVEPVGLEQLMHMNIQSDLGFNLAKLEAA